MSRGTLEQIWKFSFSFTGLLPSMAELSSSLRLKNFSIRDLSATPGTSSWFGLFPFRSPLLRKSMFLSLPPDTKMFQFSGSSHIDLCIQSMLTSVCLPGFPIRKSPDQRLFAPTRSLSQLIASFFAYWCQGIHHAPFVA